MTSWKTDVSANHITEILQNVSTDSCEKTIEECLVIPLLGLWGYQPKDWQRQKTIENRRPDFVVANNAIHKPLTYLIIEVKAPRKKLKNHAWQLTHYLRQTESIFGLLTDGLEFHFYYQHQTEDQQVIFCLEQLDQKRFLDRFKILSKVFGYRACCLITKQLQVSGNSLYTQLHRFILKIFPNYVLVSQSLKKGGSGHDHHSI
ncbi:MAG: type I restriction enzyme HsdR N-terminal domain-containing protein [Cyanobacteriota bacterium]